MFSLSLFWYRSLMCSAGGESLIRSHCGSQVDDSGKVQRLRKQCPQCGPGIFMATHFDRVYCGKCTTTYLVEQQAAGGKGKKK